MDYKELREIERILAGKIDTAWHHSWHWERRENHLTDKGWNEALESAKAELSRATQREMSLKDVVKRIEEVIEYNHSMEEE